MAARRSDLKKFKAALLARQTAIEEAINTDFGNRWRHETALLKSSELSRASTTWNGISVDSCGRAAAIALNLRFGTNRIEYQPLRVVGVISPWNYPSTCH